MHGVTHVEIPVTNIRRAKEWYGKVFGWTFQDFDKNYTLWNPPGGGTAGALYLVKKIPAKSAVRVYLDVDDVDTKLKDIKKARGTIVAPKREVPTVGWWGVFKDPQGVELYLWQSTRPQ